MCSPPGYADLGFGALVNMKTSDILSIVNDSGLTCPSCHFGFSELKEKLDNRIEFAQQLGLRHMVCSTFGLSPTATIKDYMDAAGTLNKMLKKSIRPICKRVFTTMKGNLLLWMAN